MQHLPRIQHSSNACTHIPMFQSETHPIPDEQLLWASPWLAPTSYHSQSPRDMFNLKLKLLWRLLCICKHCSSKYVSWVCILFYSRCFTGLVQTVHLPLRIFLFNDTNGSKFCVISTFRTLHPHPLSATGSISVMVTDYKLTLCQKICKGVVVALPGFRVRQVVLTRERFLYLPVSWEAYAGAALTIMHVWVWSITMFFLLLWRDYLAACDKVCVRVLGFRRVGV